MEKQAAFVRSLLGRRDYAMIGQLVEPNSKVLDLGCGEGELLEWLAENKNVDARGVELFASKTAICRNSLIVTISLESEPLLMIIKRIIKTIKIQ